MISDVLFKALKDMETYEREFPQSYGEFAAEILAVRAAMRRLQARLDDPRERPRPVQLERN